MKANIIFCIAIFIITMLFMGNTNISFKPFSISIPYWHRAVGVVLIVSGLMVYNIGEKASGYKKGLDDCLEIVLKTIKEKSNNE